MRKVTHTLAIVVVAVALAASAVLLVDYVRPAPVFCDVEGGCGMVKQTVFAYPLGVPMPAFGIAGLLGIGLLAFVPGRRARIAQAMLAVFGAIVAVGLLVVQAMMKTVCPYCAVVDTSAIVLAGLAVFRAVRGLDPPEGRLRTGVGVGSVVAAIAAPLAIGFTKTPPPPEVPKVIADEIAKTPKGKVTVVDFVDFECPFCRMTHAELSPLLAEHKDDVRVARKHVPLRMHPHALDAARAACCAEAQGKGDEVEEALFTVPPDQLTPDGCARIAREHGLDEAAFRACTKSPATDARIQADGEAFRSAHGHGLPTIWFDRIKLEGAHDRAALAAAFAQARQGG